MLNFLNQLYDELVSLFFILIQSKFVVFLQVLKILQPATLLKNNIRYSANHSNANYKAKHNRFFLLSYLLLQLLKKSNYSAKYIRLAIGKVKYKVNK